MRLRRPESRCRRWARLTAVRLVVLAALATVARPATALELKIEAPAELAGAAARVRALEGIDLADALALTGLADPGPAIRVILAGERSELSARAPSWVAGYALPPIATIVLFPDRVPSYPDRNLEALVVHEVVHVLVARAAGGNDVPRWFDEGLATVAAREWALEDRARTALALLGQRPHSVADLTASFSGDGAAAARAYALSAAFVRFVLHEYGTAVAARTLAQVAAGQPFPEAFRRATGAPLAAAESAFFRREAIWGTWVPFLTSSTALWIGITALALLAIRGRRRRDDELRERWALEEAAAAPRPVRHDDSDDGDGEGDPGRWN